MNFLVANATIYFFPILLINYKRDVGFLAIILLLVELLSALLAALFTVQGCMIIYKTRVFHPNMNRYICCFLLQWFESLVGRLLNFPYQKGWLLIPGNDASKTFFDFYSVSPSHMPMVRSFWDCPALALGMFLTAHYLMTAVMFILGLTIERSYATYLINDYECKKRPGITRNILLVLQFVSLFLTFVTCTQLISVHLLLYLSLFVILASLLGFSYIWHQNVRVHHILDTSLVIPSKYSLQARFQAKENIKSLNFIKFVVTFVGICVLIETVFLIVEPSEVFGNYEIVLFYYLELSNTVNPIAVIPLALISVPTWRRRFFEKYAFVPGVRRFILKQGKVTTVQRVRTTSQQETDQYFDQFKRAWA